MKIGELSSTFFYCSPKMYDLYVEYFNPIKEYHPLKKTTDTYLDLILTHMIVKKIILRLYGNENLYLAKLNPLEILNPLLVETEYQIEFIITKVHDQSLETIFSIRDNKTNTKISIGGLAELTLDGRIDE